jgi:lipoprotein-releasing system permease protein
VRWYLFLAFKQIFPSGRKFSIQTVFYTLSIMGVMMGVFLLFVSQSVMGGFGTMWKEKIINTGGDITIRSQQGTIYDYKKIIEYVQTVPGVRAAAPFAGGIGMVQYQGISIFPKVIGLDVKQGPNVIPIHEFLLRSSLEELDDESVFLSYSIANSLGANIGATVEFYTPLMYERLKEDEIILPRELTVAGFYETGWPDLDKNTIFVSLDLMQEFYGMGDGIHEINIRLSPETEPNAIVKHLNETLPYPLKALTWEERARDFLWILGFERIMIFLMTMPINIVGAFVIVCTQLLTVVRKTREIGLIQALGGTPRQIMAGYCFQGFFLGVLGTLLGITLALTFLHFKDQLIDFAAKITGSKAIIEAFYSFSSLPVTYSTRDFVIIVLSALILSTMASVIPSFMAARKTPAQALRNE